LLNRSSTCFRKVWKGSNADTSPRADTFAGDFTFLADPFFLPVVLLALVFLVVDFAIFDTPVMNGNPLPDCTKT
jgi:hypothetical protein